MNEIMNYSILEINDKSFTIGKLLLLILFIVLVILLLKLFKRAIYKFSKIEDSKKYSIYSLVKYFTIFFALIIALQIAGFDMTLLIAGSTALFVGLGLGIQNLFSDYISGLIILFDSSIKVGDVLDVEGLVCRVLEINLRTTQVVTRDDKYILLPNTDLTRKRIINWTHQQVDSRFDVSVGVDYGSDIEVVMNIMKLCATKIEMINRTPEPFVRFKEFGDSSLQFTVYFWTSKVFRVENIQSQLRCNIFKAFKEQGINIPFPQRVIHRATKS